MFNFIQKELMLLRIRFFGGNRLRGASLELRDDADFMYKAVSVDPHAYEYATEYLRSNDVRLAEKAVRNNGMMLQFCGNKLQNKQSVVELAVENCNWSIDFASEELQVLFRNRSL
jgi:hypothetical protein